MLPDLWDDKIAGLIRSGALVCPDEVARELEKRDDAVRAWTKVRGNMFVPIDEDILAQ